MKKYKNDAILIIALLTVAVIIYMSVQIWTNANGEYVQITVGGKVKEVLSLDKDMQYTVESAKHYNVVVIENGTVYVKEADCRDKICVKKGRIRKNGESIICLPHKVVISIVSGKENNIDAIAK